MDASEEAARGLNDIEDFLHEEAHLEAAHRRVAEFTERTAGLTHRQKMDIERWYLEEQKYVARMVTEHIAARIGVVEEHHHLRLGRWLRGTFTAMVLITLAMVTACVVLILGISG
ncbi:hypothetical protein [Streptomyces phaeochromogenes]|uniref:hypothetical protein n=1 Tax=Streptomyces phaeochromogenes TaxID=1923 RepID=UPI0006E3619A|nr:hypothetical protein [Streptomyces phaeochromogenes]